MIRIGEIILIENNVVTVECYVPKDGLAGALVCTENCTHQGVLGSLTSICIEAGKASQAFGNEDSNDMSNYQAFPHLKNSLRIFGKMHYWETNTAFLHLNQGIYLAEYSTQFFDDLHYWRTVMKLPEETMQRHIAWLQHQDSLFNIDNYLQKLSKHSRPHAWNIYLQQIESL